MGENYKGTQNLERNKMIVHAAKMRWHQMDIFCSKQTDGPTS